MSSLSFDDLFALRIELSDEFLDENIIIKELKMILLRNGLTNMDEVNNYLVGFYNNFGINMNLETIENIQINITPTIDIINQLINQTFMNSNINIPTNIIPTNIIPISDNIDGDIQNTDTDTDTDYDSSTNIINQIPASIISINEFMNSFNNLINTIEDLEQPPLMEDIKVTLKDDKVIKKYKLEKNIDDKCTICLCPLNKEDLIWELKCKHIFHQDCIKIWLKEYNYKCPVCREEAGEGETDI
tara:strand:+ start:1094 stop:1825 length:732 start_codon:yes stop_codon:yes gene_type:complete